jgi:hypothetical protein
VKTSRAGQKTGWLGKFFKINSGSQSNQERNSKEGMAHAASFITRLKFNSDVKQILNAGKSEV